MNDSISTLKLSYTYNLATVPQEKREARRQIGGMAAEIVETMRDEILEDAIVRYLRFVYFYGDGKQNSLRAFITKLTSVEVQAAEPPQEATPV